MAPGKDAPDKCVSDRGESSPPNRHISHFINIHIERMRFLALDTETTGTNPRRDRIIELFFLELDGSLNPLESWGQRFNPGIPIPPAASKVHGITDADVVGLPLFQERPARIQRLLTGPGL